MKEVIRVDWLVDELGRLLADKRFMDEPIAIEALEAVKYWAEEESVLNVE